MSTKLKDSRKKKYQEKAPAGVILSIIAAGIIPLIMRTYSYQTHLSDYEWYPAGSGMAVDVFLAYKSFAILIIGVLMVVALLYRHFADREKLGMQRLFYVIFAYGVLVLLSAVFSKWKIFAFCGSYEMFESALVVLCYVLFCYYTYVTVLNETGVKALLKWVGIFALLLMLIGVFQGFHTDLFATSFGKVLISTPSYWSDLSGLTITMPAGMAYSTLYNPNYFSLYLALVLPVAIAAFIAFEDIKARILSGAGIVCGVLLLVFDHSASGILSLVIAGIVTLLVLMSRERKRFLITVGALVAVVVIGLVSIAAVPALKQKADGLLYSNSQISVLSTSRLLDIETNDDDVVFILKDGRRVAITYEVDDAGNLTITAKDKDGNDLVQALNDTGDAISVSTADGEQLVSVNAMNSEDSGYFIQITCDGRGWYFIKESDGYYYINGGGRLVKMDNHIKSAGIFSEDFFSNRGILWNRTIPLLPKDIVLGGGQDTFVMQYPQNNYVMKTMLADTEATTIDVKPHNLYLQQWVQNGMIAMICYIIFVFGYLVQTASVIRKEDLRKPLTSVAVGLFAAILAHSAAAVANDSNVCTSPVMWIMLGLGFAVNAILKRQQAANDGKAGKTK